MSGAQGEEPSFSSWNTIVTLCLESEAGSLSGTERWRGWKPLFFALLCVRQIHWASSPMIHLSAPRGGTLNSFLSHGHDWRTLLSSTQAAITSKKLRSPSSQSLEADTMTRVRCSQFKVKQLLVAPNTKPITKHSPFTISRCLPTSPHLDMQLTTNEMATLYCWQLTVQLQIPCPHKIWIPTSSRQRRHMDAANLQRTSSHTPAKKDWRLTFCHMALRFQANRWRHK